MAHWLERGLVLIIFDNGLLILFIFNENRALKLLKNLKIKAVNIYPVLE